MILLKHSCKLFFQFNLLLINLVAYIALYQYLKRPFYEEML